MMRYQPYMHVGPKCTNMEQLLHCRLINLSSGHDRLSLGLVAFGNAVQCNHTRQKISVQLSNSLVDPARENLTTNSETVKTRKSRGKNAKQTNRVVSHVLPTDLQLPLENQLFRPNRKKLLVLDANGVLADIKLDFHRNLKAPKYIEKKAVFKRPFCDEFLKFCFEKFDIGVWSSRSRNNLDQLVDYLMGDMKHNLLFCWDSSKCTHTGFTTMGNFYKPLMLKDMEKLWNNDEPGLPWTKREYSPSNTLLIDDSPYKSLSNPPHTAIFPHSYDFRNKNDHALGDGGEFREYLEELAMADDVQKFVEVNPFGQRPISNSNPSWKFYKRVLKKIRKSQFAFRGFERMEKASLKI